MKPLEAHHYELVTLNEPRAILAHAKKLEGHTFREILELGIAPEGSSKDYGDKRYKGGMGVLVEERYFGYKANSDGRPDFPEAGVELKTTCYDLKKDGSPSAGERLVLTMIPFDVPIEDSIYDSHMWEKSKRILLVYYHRDKEVHPYDQEISYAALFTPPESDMAIIEEDYNAIRDLVQAGKAENLSEGLTRYLGACTKGEAEEKMWVEQFYPPHNPAKTRAYCFKRNYMDYVLNHYIIGDEGDSERIIKDPSLLREIGFDEYILSLISPHIGKSDRQLCRELGLEYTGNKAQWTTITYHLLGLRTEKAEEFEKANISVRTVRIEENGSVKESLSLDPFSFLKLVSEEEWEESKLCSYFEETRFFFVAFQKQGGKALLRGARFWSMPEEDRSGPLRDCWDAVRERLESGVTFTKEYHADGSYWRMSNDLPKQSDNPVAHVRPHTSKTAYKLHDGTLIGKIEKHGDRLPDGQWMTKQSFWLNSGYIAGIVSGI